MTLWPQLQSAVCKKALSTVEQIMLLTGRMRLTLDMHGRRPAYPVRASASASWPCLSLTVGHKDCETPGGFWLEQIWSEALVLEHKRPLNIGATASDGPCPQSLQF